MSVADAVRSASEDGGGIDGWRDLYVTVRDGLRLYGRHYPAATQTYRRPVLCLAGLMRNSRDFDALARALSAAGPLARDVYTLDYRGRGRSGYDANWRSYTPYFEMLDVADFMAYAGLADAAIVGSSRGGIIAMILASLRPTLIGAAVLNDIGPVVETGGFIRIMGQVGRTPLPKSWEEAARHLAELERSQFPRLTPQQWLAIAYQRYEDASGAPAAGYDRNLARSMTLADVAKGLPEMWDQFDALARVPVMVVRGEHSDILSALTVERMAARHPALKTLTVAAQGHTPLLADEPTIEAVMAFLAESDATHQVPAPPLPIDDRA